jgi:hypothetical protein
VCDQNRQELANATVRRHRIAHRPAASLLLHPSRYLRAFRAVTMLSCERQIILAVKELASRAIAG